MSVIRIRNNKDCGDVNAANNSSNDDIALPSLIRRRSNANDEMKIILLLVRGITLSKIDA